MNAKQDWSQNSGDLTSKILAGRFPGSQRVARIVFPSASSPAFPFDFFQTVAKLTRDAAYSGGGRFACEFPITYE